MQMFNQLVLLPTVWLLAMGTACISDDEFATKRNSLDEDGDGCPFSNDCDDADNRRGSCLLEIPYDGVDNDCSTGSANIDEVDVDGDGVPGIAYEVWLEQGGLEASWPESVPTTQGVEDCRDVRPDDVENFAWVDWTADDADPDFLPPTHVDAANIYPGATDVIYDGVDSDCGQENDFDGDGDGYMPPASELVDPSDTSSMDFQTAFDAYVAEWGYSFVAAYGDCFDIGDVGVSNTPSSEINPGVPAEDDAWYDGLDKDCGGNNDFDQDGDGFLPDGYDTDYTAFVELHYGSDDPPWGSVNYGDCVDVDDPNLSVLAVNIYPGAPDIAYNGADEDCSGASEPENDFDQDLDGFRAEGFETEYADYLLNWTYTPVEPTDNDRLDCNDASTVVFPGALEVLDDGNLDSDCDGGKNTSLFNLGDGPNWDHPSRTVALTTDDDYLVTVMAQERGADQNVGYTYVFNGTSGLYTSEPTGQSNSFGPNTTPIAPAYDALAASSGYFTAGSYSSYNSDQDQTTTFLYLTAYEESVIGSYDYVVRKFHADFHDDVYQGMDVIDDGADRYWVFACGSKKLHFMTVTDDGGVFTRESFDVADISIISNPTCFMSPAAADEEVVLGTVCADSSGCTSYDIDRINKSITESSSSPWSGYDFVATTTNGDWLIASKNSGGVHMEDLITNEQHSLVSSYDTVSSDAVTIDGITYLAFVAEDGAGDRTLVLTFGALSESLTSWKEVVLTPQLGTDDQLETVSISGKSGRLLISITATGPASGEDVVGWTFLGLQ